MAMGVGLVNAKPTQPTILGVLRCQLQWLQSSASNKATPPSPNQNKHQVASQCTRSFAAGESTHTKLIKRTKSLTTPQPSLNRAHAKNSVVASSTIRDFYQTGNNLPTGKGSERWEWRTNAKICKKKKKSTKNNHQHTATHYPLPPVVRVVCCESNLSWVILMMRRRSRRCGRRK